MPKREFDLEDRLIDFTVRVLNVVECLPENKITAHLSSQLIRSCTSVALNYGEAQAPESKKDFIHKAKIVLKELKESAICLRILQKKSLLSDAGALGENRELIAIFIASIKTAKLNLNWK